VTEEELRQYFLYLKKVKQCARSTSTVALCGIKFLYEHTLHRQWPTLTLVRPQRERKLPVVLSRQEVHRLLGCVRLPHYRVCLSTIYSCGLRLQEGVQLQVADIDSAGCSSTFSRGREAGIVTYPYLKTPCRCCGSTGSLIAIRFGFFQPGTEAASSHLPPSLWAAAACIVRSWLRSRTVAFRSRPPSIR
jgi:hypothetical protein